MPYVFSTIRFVPDPARGEFISLGAIAGDDESGDWDLRLISNFRRARAIDSTDRLGTALSFTSRLQASVDAVDQLGVVPGVSAMSLGALRGLAGELNNVVQITAPSPVAADSASQALDLVFTHLLLDPQSREFRFEKKHRAINSVQTAYRDAEVPAANVVRSPRVTAGAYSDDFDFSVQNGVAVQLVRCWSFQLPNQAELAEQVKAWAWVARELRESSGRVQGATEVETDPANLDVATVYVPPLDDAMAAFDEGMAAFEQAGVIARSVDQASELGELAARRLGIHQTA